MVVAEVFVALDVVAAMLLLAWNVLVAVSGRSVLARDLVADAVCFPTCKMVLAAALTLVINDPFVEAVVGLTVVVGTECLVWRSYIVAVTGGAWAMPSTPVMDLC